MTIIWKRLGAVLGTVCLIPALVPAGCSARQIAAAGTTEIAAPVGDPAAVLTEYYKIRFKLTTTAEATSVVFGNVSHFLSLRKVSAQGEAKKQQVRLNQLLVGSLVSGSPTALTVDFAVKPQIAGAPVDCTFEQLGSGTSTLSAYNASGGQPRLLQTVTTTTPRMVSFSLNLASLAKDDPISTHVPRIVEQKMLWAFYYTWYGVPWNSSILLDKPSIGYYNSNDPSVIAYHVNKALWAGIDGFLSSWWGPGDPTDASLKLLLDIAATRGFKVIINFETLDGNGPRDPSTIVSWLSYAIAAYQCHPAYMKVAGKPVIVLWASDTISVATWERIFAKVRSRGFDAHYIALPAGNCPTTDSLETALGWHYYNILSLIRSNEEVPAVLAPAYSRICRTVRSYPLLTPIPTPRVWAATAQPGYDDHLIPGRTSPILDRESGALYRATLEAAMDSNPDWVFLTSWNEWWEHTYIEPSEKYGNRYLQLTREYADGWKRQE